MTIAEMIKTDPDNLCSFPPRNLFSARDPEESWKEPIVFCRASFAFKNERDNMLNKWPNLLDWEIVKLTFTQEEFDAIEADTSKKMES